MTKFRYALPGDPVTNFDSRGVQAVELATGKGETHVYLLHFEAGGEIGLHLAGFDQLFYVIEGSAWVDVGGEHVELVTGEGATIELGQNHAKGSVEGAKVLMVQMSNLEEPRT